MANMVQLCLSYHIISRNKDYMLWLEKNGTPVMLNPQSKLLVEAEAKHLAAGEHSGSMDELLICSLPHG